MDSPDEARKAQPTEESGSSQRNSVAASELNSAGTSKVEPALKNWFENVIVPTMVRLYLAVAKN